MKSTSVALLALLALLVWCGTAGAVESFCPGGSSPDANVLMCDDWDDGTFGHFTDHSAPPSVQCGSVGFGGTNCYMRFGEPMGCDGSWGGTGGFLQTPIPNSTGVTEAWWRAYVRIPVGYNYYKCGTLGSPFPSDQNACGGPVSDKGIYICDPSNETYPNGWCIKMEFWSNQTGPFPGSDPIGTDGTPSIASYSWIHASTTPHQERIAMNLGGAFHWVKGNWYLVEVHIKLNTAGNSDLVLEGWIDDASGTITTQTKRWSFNNLGPLKNQDGTAIGNMTIGYMFLSLYANLGTSCDISVFTNAMRTGQHIDLDQIVIKKGSTGIGPMGGGGGGGSGKTGRTRLRY